FVSLPSHAALLEGLKNESEAGIIVVTGNASTKTYNIKQRSDLQWAEIHEMRFDGQYLNGYTGQVETARRWLVGLRYGRKFDARTSVFVAQSIESDVFAGYHQQYNSDLGLRRILAKTEAIEWNGEAGYRFQVEYRTSGPDKDQHLARLFTELSFRYSEFVLAKADAEYLPNFTNPSDYQLIGEVALYTTLSNVFSLKTGYESRYRNILIGNATERQDSIFTTSLVAKF
ncbi:MAG: DUF481 domain-containing protein, partial [Bdellovibrionaceae bacterium]|nr:DUF481 domain-containing protein [Pseudobdellovibrionaceae bacterium]